MSNCQKLTKEKMNYSLPPWAQIMWLCCAVTAVLGGAVWIIAVFFPYLIWTKKIMSRSLELGEKTASMIGKIQDELAPILDDLRETVHSARQIIPDKARADRVLAALESVPVKIDELAKKAENRGISEMIDKI